MNVRAGLSLLALALNLGMASIQAANPSSTGVVQLPPSGLTSNSAPAKSLITATTLPVVAVSSQLLPVQFQKETGSSLNTPVPSSSPANEEPLPVIYGIDPDVGVYARAEYLLWWVKGAPLSIPLVSTGPVNTTHHGWLINSDATVLYGSPYAPAKGGNDTQDFPAFSGGRFTFGLWLGREQRFAVEASAFALQRRTAGFEIRSNSSGLPVINIPTYNNVSYNTGRGYSPPQEEDGLSVAVPSDSTRVDGDRGILMGGVKITNSLRFWGWDAGGVVNLFRGSSWELSGTIGYRYLDLSEALNLDLDITGVDRSYAGQSGAISEVFQTRNQFFGGFLGLRGRYVTGPFFVDLMMRCALGASHEVFNIWGYYYAYNFYAPYATGPQGVFAQPANQGRTSKDEFTVVPELQIKIGFAPTSWLNATISYDYLYFGSTLRPGDQLNRSVPKGQTFQQGGPVSSTTSPVRLFNPSSFHAHGVSFGLDFRY